MNDSLNNIVGNLEEELREFEDSITEQTSEIGFFSIDNASFLTLICC